MDKKWTALVPQRSLVSSKTGKPLLSAKAPRLIGRLPEDAFLYLYFHLPLADTVNLARTCRKVAALAKDERVWKRKLALLNYKGPIPPEAEKILAQMNASSANQAPDTPKRSGSISRTKGHVKTASVPNAAKRTSMSASMARGMSENLSRTPMIPEDDGFGDFASPSASTNGHFASISLEDPFSDGSPAPAQTVKRKEEDLLMLFDDEEDMGLATASPAKPVRTVPTGVPTRKDSIGKSNGHGQKQSISFLHFSSPAPSHNLFVAYYRSLLPYYLSLKQHTTHSLVFTSPHLDATARGRILSTLQRLLSSPPICPSSRHSSSSSLLTAKRNLQSSLDHFEASMLSNFEKAASGNLHAGMREAAAAIWELPMGGYSVVQVFINKIPLFYDQSWDPMRNISRQLAPSGEYVDALDFSAMDAFMNHVLAIVAREGKTIARVFPPDSDVLIQFAERIATDVISDYVCTLLVAAHDLANPLFLLTTAATFAQISRLTDIILAIEPKSAKVTPEATSAVVYRVFQQHLPLYLSEESAWTRSLLSSICSEWDNKLAAQNASAQGQDPTFLNAHNPQQVKRNVLANFGKALLLPVTIVPKTVVFGVNAITYGGSMAFSAMSGGLIGGPGKEAGYFGGQKSLIAADAVEGGTPGRPSRARTVSTASQPSTPLSHRSLSGSTSQLPDFSGFQMLLSIETAMQLIQADRDCLKRVQTFSGYTGRMGEKVKASIEEVFIILCQTLSEHHLLPAFRKAIEQMSTYKPADHAMDESVAPLVQFFELVHIGDTIAQMVQVYYDREMAKYVDKNDFLSIVVREKKKFENALDESVASGLNAGLNILMTQAEYVLHNQQDPRDFCPELLAQETLDKRRGSAASAASTVVDIEGPTKAAQAVVECLKSHCDMLKGSTDKAILEVFHQEVALRLHGTLLKNLKGLIVSISGGFQVIADLNLYTSFVSSLKVPNVQPYFTALKMAANVFIIDSPKDLGLMARDLDRYEGTLRIEDIMEMVKCRTDWKRIEREVEKEVFGFKGEDCIVS